MPKPRHPPMMAHSDDSEIMGRSPFFARGRGGPGGIRVGDPGRRGGPQFLHRGMASSP